MSSAATQKALIVCMNNKHCGGQALRTSSNCNMVWRCTTQGECSRAPQQIAGAGPPQPVFPCRTAQVWGSYSPHTAQVHMQRVIPAHTLHQQCCYTVHGSDPLTLMHLSAISWHADAARTESLLMTLPLLSGDQHCCCTLHLALSRQHS